MSPTHAIQKYLRMQEKYTAGRIRKLRQAQGISQQEIADLLGCSRARVVRLENDGGFTMPELFAICTRLGEPPDFLRLTQEEQVELNTAYTAQITHKALGSMIRCEMPAGGQTSVPIGNNLVGATYEYSSWAFPPSGEVVAGVVLHGKANVVNSDLRMAAYVWNLEGKLLFKTDLVKNAGCLKFSPDGVLLACVTDETICVWNWVSNTKVAELHIEDIDADAYLERLDDYDFCFSYLLWHPNESQLLAFDENNGALLIWDTKTWKNIRVINLASMTYDDTSDDEFGEFIIADMQFAPDKKTILFVPGFLEIGEKVYGIDIDSNNRAKVVAWFSQDISTFTTLDTPVGWVLFGFGRHFTETILYTTSPAASRHISTHSFDYVVWQAQPVKEIPITVMHWRESDIWAIGDPVGNQIAVLDVKVPYTYKPLLLSQDAHWLVGADTQGVFLQPIYPDKLLQGKAPKYLSQVQLLAAHGF